MTNEERRKAAEWFRNRAKNCPMPGARRMYEIATEALEMAVRSLEGDGDTISRQATIIVIENSGLDDDSKDTVVRVLEQLPSAKPTQTNADSTQTNALDCVSRQQAIEVVEEYADRLQMVDWKENPCVPYKVHALNWCINILRELPSAQPEKTCCGYDEKELIAFAIACRRNEVDEKDLKTFAQDCEFAWRVMQEEFESKIREAFEKWTGGKSDAD